MAGSSAVGLFVAGVDAGVRNSGTLVCIVAGRDRDFCEQRALLARYATAQPFSA
jgi:hypothetical protein